MNTLWILNRELDTTCVQMCVKVLCFLNDLFDEIGHSSYDNKWCLLCYIDLAKWYRPEWVTCLVDILLQGKVYSVTCGYQRDRHLCQRITRGGSGVCLRGTDWPHKHSFAVSSLNILWHVGPAHREYNSTWLASSAGRHDSGLSSTIHYSGPGASWEERRSMLSWSS